QTVRELRWPDGVECPSCLSTHVIKRGLDDTAPARQRYECHDCETRFDDLTDTIFAGHHQPLKVHIPPNYVVKRVTAQRKPPEVRICRLRNQSRVGTVPPSTCTPHWPACCARR